MNRCFNTLNLLFLQACVKRIHSDESGHKHCTGQYFDYWSCVDKCVSIILLSAGRIFWLCFRWFSETTVLRCRLHQNYLKNWSNEELILSWYCHFPFSYQIQETVFLSSWFCSLALETSKWFSSSGLHFFLNNIGIWTMLNKRNPQC